MDQCYVISYFKTPYICLDFIFPEIREIIEMWN